MTAVNERTWHSRGYLPHFEVPGLTVSLTYRLANSLPGVKLAEWEEEIARLPERIRDSERRKRIESYLDAGFGDTWLARPDIGELVEGTLLFGDANRYRLHAWVVMPNHVHALITPAPSQTVTRIVHTWKSYSSHEALKLLDGTAPFWQPECFDRYIRDQQHYEAVVNYIPELTTLNETAWIRRESG